MALPGLEMLKGLAHYLFRVRGCTFRDELRLRAALVNYLFHLLTRRINIGSLGFYIPGEDILKIKTWDNYKFLVRPRTPDISYATYSFAELYELKDGFYLMLEGSSLM